MNKKLIIMLSVAVIIALTVTAFPLHIEPSHNSDWPFVITIGSPISAQEADYTCDGAADNVQFQAALNALPTSGGQLFVLAGNYTFADSTTVTRAIDHVSIIGVSAAVSFTGDGVTAIFTAGGDGWLFSNLEVDSGDLDMGATTDYMWLHVIADGTYYPLKTDSINIEDHSALHDVGAADTIFPADPGADKYLMWDDVPGQLSWEDAGSGSGDMEKATYDTDDDGDIDTAAGGTEWDSSATTGVAYITAGAWGSRSTGISNTYILIVDDADAANGDIPYFTNNGLAGYNEAEFKSAYNMEAGTDYQAYDAELAAVAGLTSAANKMIYFTGSGTADVSDLTAFARSILDDSDEATFKATVNLEIGTDVQAQDAELSALAGLTSAANKLPYFTGSGTAAVTDITITARNLLDDATTGDMRTTLGLAIGTNVQAWDGDLDDIAALSDANSNFIVGNGANWVVESGATVRESLGLIIGTDVQAYDPELAALAGLTSAADKLPYFTGSETAGVTDFSAYGRSLVAVADEAAFKLLTNLEIGVDVLAQQTIGIADDNLLEVDDADAADNDYAKFTANGLEGMSYDEVRTDLEVPETTTAEVILYVDAGSGNDGNAGTSGSPKATIQGALDALPSVIAHACTIKVRGQQDYAESNVALVFSRFSTLATITLEAVNSNDEDMFDNGTADAGAGNDELDDATKSWSVDQFNGAYVWIYAGTGKGQIREILDTTATKLTLTAAWTINPDATSKYAIGGGATLTGTDTFHASLYGKRVDFYGFKHEGAATIDYGFYTYAASNVYYDYFTEATYGVIVSPAYAALAYCYVSAGTECIQSSGGSYVTVWDCVIDGATRGLYVKYNSTINQSGNHPNHIINCTIGGRAESGGGVVLATSMSYGTGGDANGTDYSADSTAWYT